MTVSGKGWPAILVVAFVLVVAAAGDASADAGGGRPAKALLMLSHPQGLKRFLHRVSDPRSPDYRHYLGIRTLKRRYGARRSTRRAALSWLAARGLHGKVGPTGTYVLVSVPRPQAKRLFPARTAKAGSRSGREVPRALRGPVTSVGLLSTKPGFVAPAASQAGESGGADSPAPPSGNGSERPRTGTPRGCEEGKSAGAPAPNSGFTPNQYLSAYGDSRLHARGIEGAGQRVALVELGNESSPEGFARSDVRTFARCYGIEPPPFDVHAVGGGVQGPGSEATLDVEVLAAAAPGLRGVDVYEGNDSELGFLKTINETISAAIGHRGHRPDVISISYGACEQQAITSRQTWRAINDVFALAAGSGISTLVAAGDDGSSGCRVGVNGQPSPLGLLAASFPSTSPYVTAVGGTNLVLRDSNRIRNQLVWNDSPLQAAGGGGGFSVLSAKPWWQRGVKGARRGIAGQRTDGARAVPDLAALADVTPGYALYCPAAVCGSIPGQQFPGWTAIGGTSAATPLTAGGIALLNESARRHGQENLGFLNPLLYRLGQSPLRSEVFWGVRHGNNDLGKIIPTGAGGGEPLGCCHAHRGFDLANGWGSPDLPALDRAARRAARHLPPR